MAIVTYKVCFALLLLVVSAVNGRPVGLEDTDSALTSNPLPSAEANPKLYLILAEELGTDDNDEAGHVDEETREIVIEKIDDHTDSKIEKRSVEENDDLDTAAGTNVLRPLFVYRQQLAYRERVKGAVRRSGFRPRF
ncbi:uncharacterized protein LOC106636486 [Copidosoma floridanum]|uniref:uncharacterized protein LOC106636486 n=1 Tax=Copidosoma floridanum TaxID=29053 RepID=UPI0006C96F72|nr:uncharacterized protein LOC106636486 [Copidosoma floridanum]